MSAPALPRLSDPTVTHVVLNQAPPLVDYDVSADPGLLVALAGVADRVPAGTAGVLAHLGRLAGSAQVQEWAVQANTVTPVLRTHDSVGNRVDEVELHPAWHHLMEIAVDAGLHAAPWGEPAGSGAHLRRAASFYVWSQSEAGHGCPVSMTWASIPALRHAPDLAAMYEPLLAARHYQPGTVPPLAKAGLLAGMSMTEKQGGSDVRAGTTRAEPQADGTVRLTGHKWFTSSPMVDLFLVLAQGEAGLGCYLLPRVLPDGTRNAMHLMRLKDKLGNRSNPSAEIEYAGALAHPVGEPGRGIATILEMVMSTRLDCVLGAAAGMRLAVAHATHHAAHRLAFGARLADQPVMTAVLADLAVESEAATVLAIRLAAAYDAAAAGDAREAAFARLALPASKYWVCKRVPAHAAEALECLGGNGYVEDSGMPRLYREAPLNSLWEGSGNVNALDVVRALSREPGAWDAVRTEIGLSLGLNRDLDAAAAELERLVADCRPEAARLLAERIATVLQGALLVRWSPPAVADLFCATRLAGIGGRAFGALPGQRTGVAEIARRATPATG